ncbi:MAG: hypothetical protein ACI9UD_003196, partial [Glaciecola sp.]
MANNVAPYLMAVQPRKINYPPKLSAINLIA